MAETTTTTSLPARLGRGHAVGHLLDRSTSATDEPPYFWTTIGTRANLRCHSMGDGQRTDRADDLDIARVPAGGIGDRHRRRRPARPSTARGARRRRRMEPDKARAAASRDSLREYLDRRLLDHLHLRHRQRLPLGALGLGHDGLAQGVGADPLRHRRLRHRGRGLLDALPVGALRGPHPVPAARPAGAAARVDPRACRSRSPWPPWPSRSRIPRRASSGRASSPSSSPSAPPPRTSRSPPTASRSSPATRRPRSPTRRPRRPRAGGRATRCSARCPSSWPTSPGWTWNRIYMLLAAMWIPIMIAVIFAREGKQHRRALQGGGGEVRAGPGRRRWRPACGRASRPGSG